MFVLFEQELVSRGSRAQRATVDEQTRVAELQRELQTHITEAQGMKDHYQRKSQEASSLQQQLLAKERELSNQLSDLQERHQACQHRESQLGIAEAALSEQQSSLKTSQQVEIYYFKSLV